MRVDFKVALILAISAVPAGAALMVAPEYLHLSGIAIPLTFWGGIALALALILAAAIIALRAEIGTATSPGRWGFKRMWPQYLMAFAGCLFFVGLVAFLQTNVTPSREGDAEATSKSTSVFRFEQDAFVESRAIKWSDGTLSGLLETRFYLLVGNAMSTGHQIKNAKARIFFMGQEPRLARVKESGELSADIRHGEWAFFEVGKMVSRDAFPTGGFITYNDEQKKRYGAVRIEHPKHLEVLLPTGQTAYGIIQNPDLPPLDWTMSMVVTADDMVSLQLKVSLDLVSKTPVTFREIK